MLSQAHVNRDGLHNNSLSAIYEHQATSKKNANIRGPADAVEVQHVAAGGAVRVPGWRSISQQATNGWRREAAGCGEARQDLPDETGGTCVPIICKRRDGCPRGAYLCAIVS